MTLSDYFQLHGRGAVSGLAKKIGAHAPDVCRWATGKRPIPFEWCVPIEEATNGQVARPDLRPGDWMIHWPELATQKEVGHA